MDANYVFLCGMVWTQFGKEDAGLELVRALASPDQDVRVLARAMLGQAGGSKALIGQALLQNEISADMAHLCGFDSEGAIRANHTRNWFAPTSA
jgi:hypothetical protein